MEKIVEAQKTARRSPQNCYLLRRLLEAFSESTNSMRNLHTSPEALKAFKNSTKTLLLEREEKIGESFALIILALASMFVWMFTALN